MASAGTVAVVGFAATPSWASVALQLGPGVSGRRYDELRYQYFQMFVLPAVSGSYNAAATWEEFRRLTARQDMARAGVLDRISDQEDHASATVEKRAEGLMRAWGRYRLVSDPALADFVVEVRQYKWFGFGMSDQPVAFILVWPRHADPQRDNVMWMDEYRGYWKAADTVAGVFRAFREDVMRAQALASARSNHGS